MVLLIDNYDSFVHNLARYVRELGHPTVVRLNDAITLDDIGALRPTHIILSPGPCTPAEAGISNEVIRIFGKHIPVLGVCLGHQCIAAAFGGEVIRGTPVHGRTSAIHHNGDGLFTGLPNPFQAARYHSLVVRREAIPDELEVIASTVTGEVMALRHRTHPVWGVQFHPESLLTEHGYRLLERFLHFAPTLS